MSTAQLERIIDSARAACVVKNHGDLDSYLNALSRILGWENGLQNMHYGECINSGDQVSGIVCATAEQTTQAWVEVLENKTYIESEGKNE